MIELTILGEPTGKGRPKFSTVNGMAMAYTPKKTQSYENLVKVSYYEQCNEEKPYSKDIPLMTEITAYFSIPKSVSMKRQKMMLNGEIRPTKKPDTDNIVKCCLDALNGIAYYDDSQVCELRVKKLYSDCPRVVIRISQVTDI